MTCTWEGCEADGVHEQRDRDRKVWATLCQEHHDELEAAVVSMKAAVILRAWVRAQGGAKAAVQRMKGTMTTIAAMMEGLAKANGAGRA